MEVAAVAVDVFGAEDEHCVVAFDAVAAIVVACLKIVVIVAVTVAAVVMLVGVAVVVCCFLETGMHDFCLAYCSCCCQLVVLTMMLLEWSLEWM